MESTPIITMFAMVLVFSIPILAILTSFGKQWLKVRTEQQNLRVSNRDLEQKVERLQRAHAENAQRLENLETIVVSQTWNALQEPGLPEVVRQPRIAAARQHELQPPAAEELNQQRAAELAHRLGG